MSDLICMPGDSGYVVPGSDKWHEHIGCSEVANILGHGWDTANDLWLSKTHRKAKQEHKLIFDRGHDMEPKMAADCRAAGRVLKGEQAQYRDPDRPWLIYHTDGMFPKWTPLHEDDKPQHGPGVWEAKAPGYGMTMKMEEDGMASSYIDQTQVGMHVASAAMGQPVTWATFGYLDYDQYRTIMFDCPANAEYQKRCLEIIDEFWDCLVRDVPPTPIHPEKIPVPPPVKGTKMIIKDGPIASLCRQLCDLQDNPPDIVTFKMMDGDLRERLKEELGDIQLAEVPGVMRLSYAYGKPKEVVTDPLGLLHYCQTMCHNHRVVFRRSDWVETKAPSRTFRPTRIDDK